VQNYRVLVTVLQAMGGIQIGMPHDLLRRTIDVASTEADLRVKIYCQASI
jgi:hypothetical protein